MPATATASQSNNDHNGHRRVHPRFKFEYHHDKHPLEAIRALKRRIPDVVYRRLLADGRRRSI